MSILTLEKLCPRPALFWWKYPTCRVFLLTTPKCSSASLFQLQDRLSRCTARASALPLKVTWGSFTNRKAEDSPLTNEMGVLGEGAQALVFYEVPHEILMSSQVVNPWWRAIHLHLRPFTLLLALIFCESANIHRERQNHYLSFTLCLEIWLFFLSKQVTYYKLFDIIH